jgi:(+)-trans-carveol dehydrogenase
VEGKVAFVTGAARGQGRGHAVRLAEEGADIIAVDICEQIETVDYPMATPEDLEATVGLVEKLDRRVVARQVDVRDLAALEAALDDGVAELGRLDIVAANAGISDYCLASDMTEECWNTMLDINLTGVWKTCKAAIPHLVAGGRGGSIIITSSALGLKGSENLSHYASAKHGQVGLMRTLAKELAPHSIRVNSIHPGSVLTDMVDNETTKVLFLPDIDKPSTEDLAQVMRPMNMLPMAWIEPIDISNAVLFLASDEARYITAVRLPVDAGLTEK